MLYQLSYSRTGTKHSARPGAVNVENEAGGPARGRTARGRSGAGFDHPIESAYP